MDYADWTAQSSKFLRSLTWLPGGIDVGENKDGPASDEYDLEWLASSEGKIPDTIREFIATTSLRYWFHYQWKPPEGECVELQEIWPGANRISGGGDLCEQARYSNYDNQGWFDNDLPNLMQEMLATIPEAEKEKTSILTDLLSRESLDKAFADSGPGKDQARDQGLISFLIIIGDGKIGSKKHALFLDTNADPDCPPVVFADENGEGERRLISPGFDQFLTDWEKLYYITPDIETLAPWLTEDGINTDVEATNLLKNLFEKQLQSNGR